MDAKQFEEVFAETVAKSSSMLVNKAKEYADDVDRLRNFKQAAHLQSCTPRDALGGMMAKHTVSVYDMCDSSKEVGTLAQWDEKILDHINYLILLRAIVIEEIQQGDPTK